MTQRLPGFGREEGPLWVLDTSAAIGLKRLDLVPLTRQWDFWDGLLGLVRNGTLIFPSQVRKELTDTKHPDVPGAWAPKAWQAMPTRRAPDDRVVAEVLRHHPALVDSGSEADQADPYVAALALEHLRFGDDVRVLEEDRGLHTACETLGIATLPLTEFARLMEG